MSGISIYTYKVVEKIMFNTSYEKIKSKQFSIYEDLFAYRPKKPHLRKLLNHIQRDRVSLYESGYHL